MQNRPNKRIHTCPDEATLAAFVRDECGPGEREAVEHHLDSCETCRQTAAAFKNVIAKLQSIAEGAPLPDLSERIVAALPCPKRTTTVAHALVRVALLAACVLLAVIVGWNVVQEKTPPGSTAPITEAGKQPTPGPSVPVEVVRALDWLAASQELDGSWDAGKWGGQKDFTVGLTGLALLAVAGKDSSAEGSHAQTVDRAVAWLLKQQDSEGRFGPYFNASPYNHGIATVALLETYARTHREDLKEPIDRALTLIVLKQGRQGGWGYMDPMARTNTSITAWQLHALLLAESQGWHNVRPAAEKGLAWLETVIDEEGRAGYTRPGDFPYGATGVTAMAAFCLSAADEDDEHAAQVVETLVAQASKPMERIDYVQWYFVSHALKMAERRDGIDDSARLTELALNIRRRILDRQLKEGPNSGSWEPTDPWSPAGGRVYATAMATLSLQADARTDLLASRP